jgi:hypothetical protein
MAKGGWFAHGAMMRSRASLPAKTGQDMATRTFFALIEADDPDWDGLWDKWFGLDAQER